MAGGRIFADELGSESLRISGISGFRETLAQGGNPTIDRFANDNSSHIIVGNFAAGGGTELVEASAGFFSGGNDSPAAVIGRVNAVDPGATARVYGVGGPNSFINGYAIALDTATSSIFTGPNTPGVGAQFIGGFARAGGTSSADIEAYGYGGSGSFAFGAVYTSANATGRIRAYGSGAFAQGALGDRYGNMSVNGSIQARGNGAHASGFVYATGGDVTALAHGAFAHGMASDDGEVRARAYGSTALGYAQTYDIQADGLGAFATGSSANGAIQADGDNCQQFGVGVNSVNDTAQFGVGIRLHHLAAVPGAPANGSVWCDGTNIGIHSAGANQIFNRPTVTGAKGGNAALTSLLSSLASMGLIVDSTT